MSALYSLKTDLRPEMCNRPRLPIDYVIDYLFFEDNRNCNRHFKEKNNRNRNRQEKI